MRKLKLLFACLLMAVLSIGQVWGESVTYTVSSATAVSTTGTAPDGSSATLSGTGTLNSGWIQCTAGNGKTLTLSGYEGNKITAITIYVKSNASKGGGSFSVVAGSTTLASIADSKFNTTNWNGGWNSTGVSKELTMIEDDYEIQEDEGVVLTLSASANSLYIQSYTITYEEVGGDNASVSADPESVTNVAFAGVTNQTIDLTYENITGYETKVTVHPNADGTGTLSPAWLTASVSNADDYATVTYSVSANEGAARTAYIKVYTTDGDKEATTIIPVSQVKYSAPTGTFKLFSGDLTEGDYVICSGAKAMKNVATSSPRIDVADVTISDDEIVNPDESVIWKFEALTGDDAGYWTFFNEAVSKYAAFNGTDARGTLIASVTDYAKFNHVASTSYDFQNKGKTGKYLRYNNGYGFASYGNTTGSALTLYKKAVPFELTINGSIDNGSVGASDGENPITSGSNVLSGTEVTLSNTPADGFKLKAYDVYKTGASATKVTVTNGKFTMPDYAVTVSATFEATKTLSSITLSGEYRTSFWVGETFSSEGLVVTAHYEGADDEVVTPASISSPDMSTPGEKTITVTYTEGTTQSNTYTINVKALPTTQGTAGTVADLIDIYDKLGNQSNLYIKGTIYKINGFYSEKYISYWITDSYDGEANPNHSNEFELYNGLDFDGADFTAATDLEVGQYVIVKGNLTKYSSTYEFATGNEIVSRPKVLKSIALSGTYPTEFTQGDEFSSVGLVVTASYNYGDPVAVTPTSITGYNMATTGNQTVTVSYTEADVTKTATYDISVAAPSSCVHLATISKGAEVNGTFSLSVSGEQCLDELPGNVISTVLTAEPSEHYHLASVEATVGTVGTIADNECTISDIDASTIITAVFAEDDKVTFSFAKGNNAATGDAPDAIADKYAAASITLPANPFALTIDEDIYRFIGWKHSGTEAIHQPGAYTVTAADAAAHAITFTAQWEKLPIWATTYTSNVTLSGSQNVNVTITVDEEDTNFAGVKMNKGAAATFTIPAGTTHLYAHMAAWSGEGQSVTVSGDCFDENKAISIIADANVSGSGTTFDIDDAKAPLDYFKEIIIDNEITEPTVVTITAASGKRFVLFGVNAVYPAAITLDPASKDFGEVKENANAQFEFTITPNAMSTGDLVASIIGTDAAKFSASAISENKVTVTFTPGEVGGPYSASLKIKSDNAEVTATLSGTGITSATPEIGIDKTEVAFGNVEQNTTPATQSVAVTLSNIDEDGVSAAITGSAFTLSTNKLTVNGSIVITPVTTTPGTYSETLTLSANGATSKNVTVTMTVVDEWAYVYTSNVDIDSDTDAQVTIGETNYAAAKTSKGSSATITLPQGVTKIHMHLVAWKGEAQTVTVSGDCFDEDKEIVIIANDGVSGSGTTYPLGASGVDYYCSLTPDNAVAANTEITIATEGQKRFVLFGVNQEGGIVPELQSLAISGDLTNKSYKAGQSLDMTGLTVMATYTLGGTPQTPVDVTNDPGLTWTYDPLVENQEEVTVTAHFGDEEASKTITGLTVATADPLIYVSTLNMNFGSVVKDAAVPESQVLTVTLTNVDAATATLGGTNPEAFEITPAALTASGDITISVVASTATIANYSATLTISDDAAAATAKEVNLSFAVTAPNDDLSGTWNLVTDAADLMPGMQVIIAQYVAADGDIKTIGMQNDNNRAAVTSSVAGTVLTPAVGTKVFTLVDAGNGKYAFQAVNGKYLYAASSSKNYLRENDNIVTDAIWTITIGDDAKATIKALEDGHVTNNWMRKNTNSDLFSCYGSGQSDIALYAKAFDYDRVIAQGVLSTTCLPNGGVIYGASIFEVAYMDYEADGTTPHKIYFDEVEGGIMEAGVPYIVLANEGSTKFGVYYSDNENKAAQSKKGLVGYIGDGKYLAEDDYFIYNNMFYHVSAADANTRVHISNNRAYINLSDVPGYNNEPVSVPAPRRRVSLGNGAPKVATGIDALNASDKPVKMIIDGQLFILRGEKMFNANGQLVK